MSDRDGHNPVSASRRAFLGGVGAASLSSGLGFTPVAGLDGSPAEAAATNHTTGRKRRRHLAFDRRLRAARFQLHQPVPEHPRNDDEESYPNRIGSYSKGLPHQASGEVEPDAYAALLHAIETGRAADFEALPLGCSDPGLQRKLVNPLAGLAFDLEGADSHQLTMRPAPAFASAEAAGEIVENYWMALLRDVPFTEYGTSPLAQRAAAELRAMSDFRGPKLWSRVAADTLFRESLPGALVGPYISQFLWKPAPFGANFIEPRMRTALPGLDYLTAFDEWLAVQNGCRAGANEFDPVRRYIRNGRDLGQWVHIDVLFQACFIACLILGTPPDSSDPAAGGMGAPLNPGNPYLGSRSMEGFGTFGGPYMKTILCEVATRALKAAWFQKWFVHRRLRPEAFAARIHRVLAEGADYPVHADALNSAAVAEIFSRNGTYLLPMAFPEGSPLHPAYGAGHATVAGACVTILKALFDESFVIPDPVVAAADGRSLVPYEGPPLTVGGELNKLAMNVAYGRNIAGVHWRTDGIESLKLGEQVAISLLRDQNFTHSEKSFAGFTFARFDGSTITV